MKGGSQLSIISSSISDLAYRLRPAMNLQISGEPKSLSENDILYAQERHRVGPLLSEAQKQWTKIGHDAAQSADNRLKDITRENSMQFLQQKSVWLNISDIFKRADIEFWGLKGQGIAERFYLNPHDRLAKDIDIMVAPKDISKAAQLLLDNDFITSGQYNQKLSLLKKLKCLISKDIGMKHSKYAQPIELHQRLLYFEPNGLSELIRKENASGEFVSALSDTGMFYTIMHGALTYWSRLKWIVDLSFISRHIDEERLLVLLNLSDQFHCRHALIASLYWGNIVFPESLSGTVHSMVSDEYCKNRKSQKLVKSFSDMLENDRNRATRKYWSRPDFPSASWHIFDSYILSAQLIFYIPIAFILRKL